MASTTDIRGSLGAAKNWLARCLSTHESCKKRARLSTIWSSDNSHIIRDLGVGDMMPRRLLKLDRGAVAQGTLLCIQEFNQTKDECPYVALSYCWGDGMAIPKTTTENIEERKAEGVPIKELPPIFRDAIEVVIELGYDYLWIDALCILQDDQEDWKEEAPRMAVVYGNAICTLHASDSGDTSSGLWNPKTPVSSRGALDKRAWTMQERAITPRSLMFTAKGLLWECREAQASRNGELRASTPEMKSTVGSDASYTGQRGLKDVFTFFRDWRIPGTKGPDPEPYTEPRLHASYGVQGDKIEYYPFIRTWWDLIPQFTPRQLTNESDRFLAMNGVAAVAQRWAQIRSTWGLWIEFLETELLWYVDPMGPEGANTTRWLAPSWSWAAIKNGRVRNAFYEHVKTREFKNKVTLMIKPEIHIPYGTSFDQSLPIPAWRSRECYSIQMKGDLREGEVVAYMNERHEKCYKVTLNSVGRWSEEERFDFRPDVSSQFPIGKSIKVICLLMWHIGSERTGLPENVNLLLVLRQRKEQKIELYNDDAPERNTMEERTMLRVGYMECRFQEMRSESDLWEDLWNKHIWLL